MTGLRSVVIAVGLGLMLGQLATTVIADDDLTARRQALEHFLHVSSEPDQTVIQIQKRFPRQNSRPLPDHSGFP
jgi:hypothetical protein